MNQLATQIVILAVLPIVAALVLLLMPAIIEHLRWKRSVRRRVKGYLR